MELECRSTRHRTEPRFSTRCASTPPRSRARCSAWTAARSTAPPWTRRSGGAHSVKGGADAVGLPHIAEFTHALEHLLDQFRAAGQLPPRACSTRSSRGRTCSPGSWTRPVPAPPPRRARTSCSAAWPGGARGPVRRRTPRPWRRP
ncbi:Hpt domain-containing protein [Frigoriglobus tundricola]|uniref:Hpt domain-containing protein n=1 Tax=Frigoriglobus tundricola TaxID=2774151 RepID=UPI001D0816F5